MKIVTNTASLFTPEEGKKFGISVIPVSVFLKGRSMRDYVDIDADGFVDMLKEDAVPLSSQPALGDVMNVLEESDEETIMLTVGDGLSGEYETAMGVRNTLPNKERIHIINSGSLGGPLHHLVRKAIRLRAQGLTANEITTELTTTAASSASFVIPADFQYLERSGRIMKLTSKIGGALKLLPVLTQSEDRKRISLLTIKRSWKAAVEAVSAHMSTLGVNENYLISIAFADTRDLAEKVRQRIREHFPRTENELLQLSPSLITHGGPGCIVVQAIRK